MSGRNTSGDGVGSHFRVIAAQSAFCAVSRSVSETRVESPNFCLAGSRRRLAPCKRKRASRRVWPESCIAQSNDSARYNVRPPSQPSFCPRQESMPTGAPSFPAHSEYLTGDFDRVFEKGFDGWRQHLISTPAKHSGSVRWSTAGQPPRSSPTVSEAGTINGSRCSRRT